MLTGAIKSESISGLTETPADCPHSNSTLQVQGSSPVLQVTADGCPQHPSKGHTDRPGRTPADSVTPRLTQQPWLPRAPSPHRYLQSIYTEEIWETGLLRLLCSSQGREGHSWVPICPFPSVHTSQVSCVSKAVVFVLRVQGFRPVLAI